MSRLLLILCLALPALAQPLPLAWQDLPQGAVLYTTTPHLYDGAALAVGTDELVTAWCDMRDGYGRLMLQKHPVDAPAGAGVWHSDVEGLGPVDALVGPVSATAPFSPTLATDGEGGAFVLWQEIHNEYVGALHLQRIGDGPGGEGGFAWPASLVVAPEVPIPYEGCRDGGERCRALADENRAVCADGAGGVWVLWRDLQNSLLLQHVLADGGLDPDFPATGLALPVSCYDFQLRTDAAGNALLVHAATGTGNTPLFILGVGQDGGLLPPGAPRLLSAAGADIYNFRCAATGDGRLLVAWIDVTTSQVRAQLLDENLADLWPAEGLLVDLTDDYSVFAAVPASGAPVYLAYNSGGAWKAQALDELGQPVWDAPMSLDVFTDEYDEQVLALAADGEGLAYALDHGGDLCLQRLTAAGATLWPPAQTRVTAPGHYGRTWWLAAAGQADTRLLWRDGIDANQHLRLTRRDAAGGDLHDEAASVLLGQRVLFGDSRDLVREDGDPLLVWGRSDSLLVQSIHAQDGRPAWGMEERPVGPGYLGYGTTSVGAVVDGEHTWVLTFDLLQPNNIMLLSVQRLDAEGQPAGPRVLAMPGLADLPDFWGQERAWIVVSGGRAYLAAETWLGNDYTIRLQCVDAEGNILWGDEGLDIYDQPGGTRTLAGLQEAPDGGVDVAWVHYVESSAALFLQHYDPDGEPSYTGENGRGLRSTVAVQSWYRHRAMFPLPDGGRLLESHDFSNTVDFHALDAAGATRWSRHIVGASIYGVQAALDPQGRLWVSWLNADDPATGLVVERLRPDGETDASWNLAGDPDQLAWYWTLTHGADGRTALVTGGNRPNYVAGLQMRGYLLEDQAEPALLFDAPLLEPAIYTSPFVLKPAPQGDVWLGWRDDRGAWYGYGMQARLTRLDVLDANTSVDDGGGAAPPEVFTLGRNHPNPFNPETWITFSLAQAGPARLEVFNLAGQRVRLLQDGSLPAGSHRLRFDARDEAGRELGSGLYFYQLSSGGQSRTERMLLVR